MVNEIFLQSVSTDIRVAVIEVTVPLATVLSTEFLCFSDGYGIE